MQENKVMTEALLKGYIDNIAFLRDRKRVYAFFLDYFNGDNNQVKRLMKGYDAGVDRVLINKNFDETNFNRILYFLINNEDLKEEKAYEIINFWKFALGINVKNADTNKDNIEKAVIKKPQSKENIKFNKNGCWIKGMYYLDDKGVKQTNCWIDDSYYVNKNGVKQKDCWINDMYYVGKSGIKKRNCWIIEIINLKNNTKEYYTNYSELLKKSKVKRYGRYGYVLDNCVQNEYFLDDNGIKKTLCWIEDKYYVNYQGIKQKNCWIDDTYYVNEKGVKQRRTWINGTYYVDKDGIKQKSCWIGNMSYVNEVGIIQRNSWIDNKYYVDEFGKKIKDTKKLIDDEYYIFDFNGKKICNETINNVKYDENGKEVTNEKQIGGLGLFLIGLIIYFIIYCIWYSLA